jgi:hypothetical protein
LYTSQDYMKMQRLVFNVIPPADEALEELLPYLMNTSYLHIWKANVKWLLKIQGPNRGVEKWVLCKATALDLLELREDMVVRFGDIQEELRSLGLHKLCDSILLKLKVLKLFKSVYNRLPVPFQDQKSLPSEPTFNTGVVPQWKPRVVEAYPHTSIDQRVGLNLMTSSIEF